MPLQINSITIKRLIAAQKRDNEILKKRDEEEVQLLDMSEAEMYKRQAERLAISKALEEMGKQRTTQIKAEQIKLF